MKIYSKIKNFKIIHEHFVFQNEVAKRFGSDGQMAVALVENVAAKHLLKSRN